MRIAMQRGHSHLLHRPAGLPIWNIQCRRLTWLAELLRVIQPSRRYRASGGQAWTEPCAASFDRASPQIAAYASIASRGQCFAKWNV
jgi:hypothetical protein